MCFSMRLFVVIAASRYTIEMMYDALKAQQGIAMANRQIDQLNTSHTVYINHMWNMGK